MLKLTPNPTFTASVALSVPGQAKPATIEVEFKYLKRKQVGEFFERVGKAEVRDAEALGELIQGWKGVDEDYSPEALETLLEAYPAASRELFAAFTRELMESKAKN